MTKIKEFQTWLCEQHCAGAVFLNTNESKKDPSIQYLAGVMSEHALLFIPNRGTPILHVTPFEVDMLKKHAVVTIEALTSLKETIKEYTAGKIICTNHTSITLAERKLLPTKIIDCSSIIQNLRRQKTEQEQDLLKKSATKVSAIVNETIAKWNFKTEQEVAAFLLHETHLRGLKPSFPPIVASGTNASQPHHEPYGKLKRGFCVIDYGVIYKNYCSDMTRTVFIGSPTQQERQVYELVLAAQELGIKQAVPFTKCSMLHNTVAEQLGKWKKHFTHGLGHGLGIEVHESPSISSRSKDTLEKNMCVTIEPGIYPSQFGIRIEDDIIVKNKPVVLTTTPKELRCIR